MCFYIALAATTSLRWNSTGITVAGQSDIAGTSNNLLNSPAGIAFDPSYTALYIAEANNHRVQKWIPGASTGTTVAGQSDGTSGSSLTHLNSPRDIEVDANENIYVADLYNHRIVMWPNGASIATIIAGNGMQKKYTNIMYDLFF